VRPAGYSLSQDIRATLVRVLAYMGGLAFIAIAAGSYFHLSALVADGAPSAHAQWIEVEGPYPAFELAMPELAAVPANYAIWRRDADGARKDVLTWGGAAEPGPFVSVEIYRAGDRREPFLDPDSEIAARIVGYAVTDDVTPAGRIASKFGTVSLIDFAISAHNHPRRCLGFTHTFDQPSMQIAGWYCSPGEEIVDRATLACVVDRLTILSAGGDPRLDALFARAEVRRTFCGRRDPIFAATPERTGSIPRRRGLKPHQVGLRENIQLR
jgi:hypothetical protein